MLLPELEADGASEIDELLFAEAAVQPGPELVSGAIRVVRDRVGPLEGGPLGIVEASEVRGLGLVRQIPVAELFDALVDDASVEDVLADVAPARERIRHERPDLVHHVSIKPVVYGSLAAKAVGVPAVINAITGLGTAFGRPGLRGSALRWGLTVVCRAAFAGRRTRVIFQNPDDLTWFVRRGVVASERALLIRGAGVDVNRFRPAPGPAGAPIVMLASRLLWDKGVGEFVEASRRLKESGLACRIAGPT